jgi:hypothetical protein
MGSFRTGSSKKSCGPWMLFGCFAATSLAPSHYLPEAAAINTHLLCQTAADVAQRRYHEAQHGARQIVTFCQRRSFQRTFAAHRRHHKDGAGGGNDSPGVLHRGLSFALAAVGPTVGKCLAVWRIRETVWRGPRNAYTSRGQEQVILSGKNISFQRVRSITKPRRRPPAVLWPVQYSKACPFDRSTSDTTANR